jgi:hypothetical protein
MVLTVGSRRTTRPARPTFGQILIVIICKSAADRAQRRRSICGAHASVRRRQPMMAGRAELLT